MNPAEFYPRVIKVAALPPQERHVALANLHTRAFEDYLAAVNHLNEQNAHQIVPVEGDPRTYAQLIGHIAEWDRFTLLSAGDILAGIEHPRCVTDMRGYIEPDGKELTFASVDEFNAYQARKHAQWDWRDIQRLAVEMGTALHTLFTHPTLLTAQKLEQTQAWQKRLRNRHLIENITMGWTLWLIEIEHIAVEHAVELDALAAF